MHAFMFMINKVIFKAFLWHGSGGVGGMGAGSQISETKLNKNKEISDKIILTLVKILLQQFRTIGVMDVVKDWGRCYEKSR